MTYVDLHYPSPPRPGRRGPRRSRRPCASPAGWTPRACVTSPAPRTSSARTSRASTSPSSRAAARRAQRAIDAEGLDVRLHPGGELAARGRAGARRARARADRPGPAHAPWLLLECPFEGLDDVFDAAVARLTGLGYGLLLAHPERAAARSTGSRPHVEAGALLQVNVSSLLGDHGPRRARPARRARAQRPRLLPRVGHAPRHARGDAPARLPARCAASARATSRPSG